MNRAERIKDMGRLAFHLANNWTSFIGVGLTTSAGFTMLYFWIHELVSSKPINPYMGILLFAIIPALFILGLLLIPAGILLRRRRLKKEGRLEAHYPKIDLALPSMRRLLVTVGIATIINMIFMTTATFKGVEYMDSNQFCGLTCHTVMSPEYTAFLESPHSRVGCAQCHIGPGAGWFVKSKLSGTRQLLAVTFKTFSRPIPSPVEHLRPARETCEQCHWPQKFTGDKLFIRTKFAEDEANTPATTILSLKIGGHSSQGTAGIHGRHLDEAERISYLSTDDRRQEIPKVTYREDNGQLVDYVTADFKNLPKEKLAKAKERKMDCVDCHSRPTHAFDLPDRAMDKALAEGRISPELPYIKKKGMEALKAEYPDRATAASQIPKAIADFYRTDHPEVYKQRQPLVDKAAEAIKAIYLRNVFPEMKITWGTHFNNIGHEDAPGCFRCHDGSHTSASGKTIKADCDTCHSILAQDEKDPKILKDLGMR